MPGRKTQPTPTSRSRPSRKGVGNRRFGNLIRRYRTLRGMRQVDLGPAVGRTREDISAIERGNVVNPPPKLVAKLKKVLTIPADEAWQAVVDDGEHFEDEAPKRRFRLPWQVTRSA